MPRSRAVPVSVVESVARERLAAPGPGMGTPFQRCVPDTWCKEWQLVIASQKLFTMGEQVFAVLMDQLRQRKAVGYASKEGVAFLCRLYGRSCRSNQSRLAHRTLGHVVMEESRKQERHTDSHTRGDSRIPQLYQDMCIHREVFHDTALPSFRRHRPRCTRTT